MNLLFFACFNLLTLGIALSFEEFKIQMEKVVQHISQDMSKYYQEWEEGQNSCKCDYKSFNSCQGVKEKKCNYQFPEPSICLQKGQFASAASSIKFPQNINNKNLVEEDIRFVCTSARLEDTFSKIELIRQKKFTNIYFGNNRGLFRRFPGEYRARNGVCDQYDPRIRPWYTIAASGAKNVLIVIDRSSSMRKVQDDVKFAASAMIDTLSISDNVGVITFTNNTNVMGENKKSLIQATSKNKNILKNQVKNIQFSYDEQTNFVNVFQKSLQIFNETIFIGQSGCSQAENVLLLITDGNPTQGNLSSSYIIEMVKNFTNNTNSSLKRVILFVYALGKVDNTDYIRDLTCQFNGMVLTSQQNDHLTSTSAAATKLQIFYQYLSVGVTFTTPIWTEPYMDYYTGIQMVTASMPAYYTNKTTNLTTVFGVAGIDIILNQFNRFGYTQDDVIVKLIGQSACQKNLIDSCKLQFLRSPLYKCKYSNCIDNFNTTLSFQCKNMIPSQIFTTQHSTKDIRRCCGLTNNEFAFIMGGSVVLALIVGLIVWKRKRIIQIFFGNRYRRIQINTNQNSNSSNIEIVGHQNKKSLQKSQNSQNKQSDKKQGYFPSESQSGIINNEM